MAFDITPYIDMKPSEVRKLIREGVIDFPTAGMCRGYAQANLIILPPEYAGDFEEFARRNPFPCPILEIVRGTPETHDMGEGGNICTDIPKYRIYRDGKWDGKELTDVSGYGRLPGRQRGHRYVSRPPALSEESLFPEQRKKYLRRRTGARFQRTSDLPG